MNLFLNNLFVENYVSDIVNTNNVIRMEDNRKCKLVINLSSFYPDHLFKLYESGFKKFVL